MVAPTERPCRIPDDSRSRADVVEHDGACADDCLMPDVQTRQHRSVEPNEYPVFNLRGAAEPRSRADIDIVSEADAVVDARMMVDDAGFANSRESADNVRRAAVAEGRLPMCG